MPGVTDLKKYQWTAFAFLLANPFGALWLDLGLGKTVSVLTLLWWLLAVERSDEKVLIVAPLRVALQTWPTEIAKWDHTRELTYTVIRSTGKEPEVIAAMEICRNACRSLGLDPRTTARLAAKVSTQAEREVKTRLLYSKTQIHIINREALFWLVQHFGKKFPYKIVIFDESSGLRDIKSDRFKAMLFARKYMTRCHQLTGTPAPESFLDLFPQVYLMDRGQRFGKHITKFRLRYFDANPFNRSYKIREGAADEITDKIADIVLPMKAIDYHPMSPPLVVDRVLRLTPEQREQYDKLESEFLLSCPTGEEIEADNAAALAQKLLQYASGAVYDKDRNTHAFHDHKIEELRDIREQALGSPILVAYWFKSSLARLKAAFPDGKQMDKEGSLQHPWNRGEVPLMFLHPNSGGHGLNLQEGGHIIVWFDICYPLELYDQLNGRIYRQGQKHVVTIVHLIVKGTLDALIVPKLKAKEKSQAYLFARLKMLRDKAHRVRGK